MNKYRLPIIALAFCIGMDAGSTVSREYEKKAPFKFRFTGKTVALKQLL